jgi:GTPase Era involved in 16S rRNA processing
MKDKYLKAINITSRAKFAEIQRDLEKNFELINNPEFRIAVTGEFKAGKSTLINKLFLKKNILFTDTQEATAVPTEITFGKEPQVAVYPYTKKLQSIGDGEECRSFDVVTGEGDPEIYNKVTQDLLKSLTSADTPEGRAHIADTVSRVRLSWKDPNLSGFVIIDTPGVNSTNESVVNTTYQILPKADLNLFVTTATQLSQAEINFLKKKIFGSGFVKNILLINYDPDFTSETSLTNIESTIRSQLANIGYHEVEIIPVNLREKDTLSSLTMLGEKVNNDAVVDDDDLTDINSLFDERPKSNIEEISEPHPHSTLSEVEKRLVKHIKENALEGRKLKAKSAFDNLVSKAILQCEIEIEALKKSPEELEAIREKIKESEKELKKKYNDLASNFLDELRILQKDHLSNIDKNIHRIESDFTAKTKLCSDLSELQRYLKASEESLRADLENMLVETALQTHQKVKELEGKYQLELKGETKKWMEKAETELEIKKGKLQDTLDKTPGALIWIGEVVIFDMLLPFGFLIGILARLISGFIPMIKDLLPSKLANQFIQNTILGHLNKQFDQIRSEIRNNVNTSYEEAYESILVAWEENSETVVNSVNEPLLKAMKESNNPEREKVLITVLEELKVLEAN